MTSIQYLVCREGDIQAENRQYEDCTKRKAPLIVVKTSRESASVTWDHITLPCKFDDCLLPRADEMADRILMVRNRFGGRRTKIRGSALVGTMSGLKVEDAKAAASEIFAIFEHSIAEAGLR